MLTFRKATIDDAETIAGIMCRSWVAAYTGLVPEEYITEQNATRLKCTLEWFGKDHDVYVAVLNSKIVGIGVFTQTGDEDLADYFEVRVFYLDPDYFRRGIGRKFMDYALDLARAGNYPGVLLYVLENNRNAQRFYEACGFVCGGKRKAIKHLQALENIRYVLKI